jgi:hypothetical protein
MNETMALTNETVSREVELQGPVFVLGAGFSRAISARIPDLKNLSSAVWNRYAHRQKPDLGIRDAFGENIEDALSFLAQPKPWVRESTQLQYRSLFLELTEDVAAVIGTAETDSLGDFASGAPGWVNQLLKYWHDNRCAVLTLNYDTMIERFGAEFSLGPDDRNARPCTSWAIYPPFMTRAVTRSQTIIMGSPAPTFQLLKLHGSVNWFYSGRDTSYGETIYYVEAVGPEGFWTANAKLAEARERAAVSDKFPFIVPPVFDKTALLTHESIRSIWSKAHLALRSASRVIFVGYSLPWTDRTMLNFLRDSIKPDSLIEIVDLREECLTHFRQSLGQAYQKISQSLSGENCIQELAKTIGTR